MNHDLIITQLLHLILTLDEICLCSRLYKIKYLRVTFDKADKFCLKNVNETFKGLCNFIEFLWDDFFPSWTEWHWQFVPQHLPHDQILLKKSCMWRESYLASSIVLFSEYHLSKMCQSRKNYWNNLKMSTTKHTLAFQTGATFFTRIQKAP